ncbi:hypothetical protein [Paenibacillus sp. WC2504]|uniref:hypothetical protein n=1 Tax=Paenibacillus sp. WC2504 TaxID=3461403 RepID=UPI0040465174
MKTQKDWLDYINRLQDRERQKITSGGLSNWVLFVALAGLGYWVYPDIVYIQKHWLTVLIGFVFFNNLSISLFDIFNNHYRQDKINGYYEAISIVDIKGSIPLKFLQKINLIVALLSNGYFVYYSITKDLYWLLPFFLLYFLRYLPELATLIIPKSLKKYKQIIGNSLLRLAKKLNPELNTEIVEDNRIKSQKQFNLNAIFKIAMPCYFIIYVCLHYDFNDLLWKQIFDGLALVIMMILLQFLLMIFMKRMKIAWLEELEKKIVNNNLSQEEIVKELQEGYFNLSGIDNYF